MTQLLKAIVCGYEKSGTTLINEILRRHPELDSGFEGGFLMASSPRQFQQIKPYYGFFRTKWRLSREDMAHICDTDDWQTCYERARALSPIIENKQAWLFDKTPRYMLMLDEVLTRMPQVPCVVSVRDPRALMHSWARWSGHPDDPEPFLLAHLDEYTQRFLSYARGYQDALANHGQRILLSQFETLCQHPEEAMRAIFEFIGMDFDPAYLSFNSEHFVYGNTVSVDYLCAYRQHLSDATCREILHRTGEFSQWQVEL
jgi:Sulfotransferase family